MAKTRFGRDKRMHVLKLWLLDLKNIQAINLKTLSGTNPLHGSHEHQQAIIELKKQYNHKI
jgi:hypothetical protein